MIDQEGADGGGIGAGFEEIGEFGDGIAGEFCVVVEEEDVRAVGGAGPDVHGFDVAEVFRQADEADGGEFEVEGKGFVAGGVIDDDDLVGVSESGKAAAEVGCAVAGDDDDGDAGRLGRFC